MAYFIYILYSPGFNGHDRYYVGHTHDLEARLEDHNAGDRPKQSRKYTFKHRPWEFRASYLVGEDRGEAVKIERYIKRQKSRKFIEQLIEADPDEWTQLVRVPARRD